MTHITIPTIHQELLVDTLKKPLVKASPLEQLEFMILIRHRHACAITDPIIEAAIPREDIEGIIAEQRVVFNFNYSPQYLFSYSKVAGPDDCVAGQYQGGDEPVRKSFRRIIEGRMSLPPEEIESAVEDTVTRMKMTVSQFATDFDKKAREFGFHYGPIFAIDVCPVWDSERQQIEFWLLEVQPGPGTLGAEGNIPPDEAAAVKKYNAKIFEDMSYLE